jgi:hypothetical protein
MIRNPAHEQRHRLTVKTLDQVFIMRVKEGLGCSQFEAAALTDLVKGVSQRRHGVAALRQRQMVRMAHEALDQGAVLTAEDFAFRIFNCGLRTISRDLKALADQGIVVPLRSQQKDVGRALSHRVLAVELYLKRHTFTQIRQRIYHSLPAIANYVVTFAVVVAHTRDGHSVDEIAFLMQILPALVRQYQALYEQYNTPEYQGRIDEIIRMVKARGFRPRQLDSESDPDETEKGGMQP